MAEIESLVAYLEKIVVFHESERISSRKSRQPAFTDDDDYSLEGVKRRHQLRKQAMEQEELQTGADPEQRKEYVSMMRNAVKAFNKHPLLAPYKFRAADLDVVAKIFHQTAMDFDTEVSAREIIKMSPCLDNNLSHRVKFITGLLEREIISFCNRGSSDFRRRVHLIIDGRFTLNCYLLNLLMGRNPIQEAVEFLGNHLPISTYPLKTISKAMKIHFFAYSELRTEVHEKEGYYFGRTVHQLLDLFLVQIYDLPYEHALHTFIREHKLSDFDLKCLLIIYFFRAELEHSLENCSLANLLARDADEYESNVKAIINSKLIDEMLITVEVVFYNTVSIELTENALSELETEVAIRAKNVSTELESIVKRTNLLSIVETKQTLRQLILPDADMELLSSTMNRLKHPEQYDLSRWGLLSPSLSSDKEALKGCNILLHGHPGTGKSFIAGVMANELGRSLVQVNANNIRDSYYGKTEKQARKLFKLMKDIIAQVQPAPVFLLNEGDQIIHKRSSDFHESSDNTENAIQNIFLEEMESFPGILIVTTNLVENMDEAMSRRFHYKLELQIPDKLCREKLWHLHLPSTIPGSAEIDVQELAARFCFTGGQIRIVVQNACYKAMLRGSEAVLQQADIVQFAELESNGSFETAAVSRIGFALE